MGIIRLTLFSVLGIGGAMLWFGRDEGLPEDRLGYVPAPPDVVAITPPPAPTPAPTPTPVAAAPAPAPTPPPPAPGPPTLYVTGTSVNMRAGTSTREAILARLARGTEVAFLGKAADGWSRIRVIESGTEGFMASQFLSPDQP